MTISDWVDRWRGIDDVAFGFEGDATSYGALAEQIDNAAAALVEAGVVAGDRVGFCGLNRVEVFMVLFACARLGAIFVPLNNRLTAVELAVQIEDSTPRLLLATDGFHTILGAATILPVRDLDADPFAVTSTQLPDAQAAPDDTALMMYTSGTTGRARGAMLSHDAVLHTVLNSIDHQGLTGADRILSAVPTFHVGGLNIQVLPTLYVGGEVLLMRRFDPGETLALIAENEATQALLVPAMLTAVAAAPDFASTDLSSLRGINTGSSIVPLEVMQPFFDRGIPVGQVYGATETGPTAVVLDYQDAAEHMGTCGCAATHTEIRIVDRHGADVADGTAGELWVRGPNIFSGYWNDAGATEAAFAEGSWFRTGDVGTRSPDGYITISDRIKDVIISGGENIYPAELEPVIAEHPEVVEVAVIGQADERWGEVPVAVVVLTNGSDLSIAELRGWLDGRLARFKYPRAVHVVDQLPRTALGKVKKHELRALPMFL